MQTLRNTGMGLGGALGAVLVAGAGTGGLRVLVVLNAASYALATGLLASWRPLAAEPARPAPRPGGAAPGAGRAGGGYRAVLRDRRYLLLVVVHLAFVFGSMIISMLLAVYLTEGLHRDAWLAGTLLVLNGVQVVLTQNAVARRLERFRPTRVVAAGALLNALSFGLFALLAAAPGWIVPAGLFAAMAVYNLAETVATPTPRSSASRWPTRTGAAATSPSTSSPGTSARPSPPPCSPCCSAAAPPGPGCSSWC